jgi:hypothetical protein
MTLAIPLVGEAEALVPAQRVGTNRAAGRRGYAPGPDTEV